MTLTFKSSIEKATNFKTTLNLDRTVHFARNHIHVIVLLMFLCKRKLLILENSGIAYNNKLV